MSSTSSEDNARSSGGTWLPDIGELAAGVRGPVLTSGSNGYEEETAVFNPSVTHRPAVVVGAVTPGDVRAAVRFAARHDLNIAVLNTGHGPSLAASDDTLLIATRRMSGVTIDPAARTARVGAGVRFQQLVDAAAEYGLAPLPGSSPGVGVVGYTLGGGASLTMGRKYGWASDHVTAMDVVTADGEPHHVSRESEADLFGALLAGKGNFGVVTAMEFSLFEVTSLYAGALFYAGADTRAVLEAYRRFTHSAPDEISSGIVFLNLPPLPTLPPFMQGKPVVSVRVSFAGAPEEGQGWIAPLRDAAPVLMDTVSQRPYTDFASITMDPTDPVAAVEQFGLLEEMSQFTADAIVDLTRPDAGTGVHVIDIRHLGGAFSRPSVTPNGPTLDAAFMMFCLTVVPPGEDVAAYADSGRAVIDRLRPWLSEYRHPGYLAPGDATQERTREAYDRATYGRLRSAKTLYDPANRFRLNHNIPPWSLGRQTRE